MLTYYRNEGSSSVTSRMAAAKIPSHSVNRKRRGVSYKKAVIDNEVVGALIVFKSVRPILTATFLAQARLRKLLLVENPARFPTVPLGKLPPYVQIQIYRRVKRQELRKNVWEALQKPVVAASVLQLIKISDSPVQAADWKSGDTIYLRNGSKQPGYFATKIEYDDNIAKGPLEVSAQ
jgi:hypothetical protein